MSIKLAGLVLTEFFFCDVHNKGNQTRNITVMTKRFVFAMHWPRSDSTRNYGR